MSQPIEINSHNFDTQIIAPSKEKPVVLYFSSSRHPKSEETGLLLQKYASILGFTLGVVNLDTPENAQFIELFRVQSLPDVRLISNGEIVDAISGLISEEELKTRLEKFFLSNEKQLLVEAEGLIQQKKWDLALILLDEALQTTPEDKNLLILKAKALLGLGNIALAKEILSLFTEADDEFKTARSLLELLEFHAEAAKTDIQGVEAQIYHEASVLASQNEYKMALSRFLDLAQVNKNWNDEAASKAMLTLFGVLGPKHELTWEFRARLNTILFV